MIALSRLLLIGGGYIAVLLAGVLLLGWMGRDSR